MAIDVLLSRLDSVRHVGPGRWVARCPAHSDRQPSLAVRELEDGRVLVHDFGGCRIEEVLSAVGLNFDVLFPELAIGYRAKRERRPFNPHDILACIEFEALLVAVAAARLARGETLSDVDRRRLMLAALRLSRAAEAARGA